MGEAIQLARTIAKEYSDRTNASVETYYKQTSEALREMSVNVSLMARSVTDTNKQLARYEERQNTTAERLERMEGGLKDQGINRRKFENDINEKLHAMELKVSENTTARRVLMWLGGVMITAMIGGGVLFSSLTGKG